jgi:hypothetical protein
VKNAVKERKINAIKTTENMFAMAAKHVEKDDEFLIMAKGYADKQQKMKPLQHL